MYLSPRIKESGFFAFRGKEKFKMPQKDSFIRDDREYSMLFDNAHSTQLIGEVCTWYLYHHEDTIRNIQEIYGPRSRSSKLLAILRNPIERAASHYGLGVRIGLEPLRFRETIRAATIEQRMCQGWISGFDYIGYGMYSKQIKNFMDHFPNMKLLWFEDLKKDTQGFYDNICDFLGVRSIPLDAPAYNKSAIPDSPFIFNRIFRPIHLHVLRKILPSDVLQRLKNSVLPFVSRQFVLQDEDRDLLREIYANDIRELSEITGRNLSHWLV